LFSGVIKLFHCEKKVYGFSINFAMPNKFPEKNDYPSITSLESFFLREKESMHLC